MAHDCDTCGGVCYCCGDIDDIVCRDAPIGCTHCPDTWLYDDEEEDEYEPGHQG